MKLNGDKTDVTIYQISGFLQRESENIENFKNVLLYRKNKIILANKNTKDMRSSYFLLKRICVQ